MEDVDAVGDTGGRVGHRVSKGSGQGSRGSRGSGSEVPGVPKVQGSMSTIVPEHRMSHLWSSDRRRVVALALAIGLMFSTGCGKGRRRQAAAPTTRARASILLDHARHDAGRRDRAGRDWRPDARVQRARRTRAAVQPGVRGCPGNAAVAHLDDDRPLPGGHGIHENARYLPATFPVVAERLQQAGYRTTAFVSSFSLARRFGLARGFDLYDDELPDGSAERSARETTDLALAELTQQSDRPRFIWVHFYDAHYPYAPPEPFRTRYKEHPYLGEVASVDEQLGRLARGVRAAGEGPGRDHRRCGSWRGARRSRRGAARQPALSIDDARAADCDGAWRDEQRQRCACEHAPGIPYDPRSGQPRIRATACSGRPERSSLAKR